MPFIIYCVVILAFSKIETSMDFQSDLHAINMDDC
jgi:hypothetical protein